MGTSLPWLTQWWLNRRWLKRHPSSFIETLQIQRRLQIVWILGCISASDLELVVATLEYPGVEIRETETTVKDVNNNHTPHKGVMKSRGYGSPGLEPSHTINTTHTTLGKLLVLIVFQFVEYSYKVQYKRGR